MTAYHRVLCIYCCTAICTDYYCCFHLTSGTSTALGPSIVHRNRKRFLLSQSTLREEFVEKMYQVFDIIAHVGILLLADPLAESNLVSCRHLVVVVVVVVVCYFSHSAHWLPTRKKLLYTVANPARGLLNREKKEKEKVWQRNPPPPPRALLVRRKNKKLENKKLENHAAHTHA